MDIYDELYHQMETGEISGEEYSRAVNEVEKIELAEKFGVFTAEEVVLLKKHILRGDSFEPE